MAADVVQVDDLLFAMADSVMETVPKPFNPMLKFQDKTVKIKLGGKPPREIFYRNTLTFLTKLPPPVQPKQCSCQYLCDGDAADIKCHSCSIYAPTNSAFYCRKCFDARHPWYRVAHIYSTIDNDESIEHTIKVAHRISEAIRYEKEGQEMLHGLMREKERVKFIADDEKVDNQVREYGRRAVALEEHIEQLRRNLRVDAEVAVRRKSLVMNHQMHERWMVRLSVHMDQSAAVSNVHKSNLEEALAAAQKFLESDAAAPPKLVPQVPNLEKIMPMPKKSIRGSITASFFVPPITLEPVTEEGRSDPKLADTELTNTDTAIENLISEETNSLSKSSVALPSCPESSVSTTIPTTELDSYQAIAVNEPKSSFSVILEATEDKSNEKVDHYVIQIQKVFRGYLSRRTVSDMMMMRLIRVWSPTYGREYYFDRITGQSSWILTKLIMKRSFDDVDYVSEDSQYLKWVCKRNCSKRLGATGKNAVLIIQGFGRCILARRRAVSRANLKFRRVWDADSGTFYYADISTGGTSWQKSGIYLSVEPPVYLDENSNRKKRSKKAAGTNARRKSSMANTAPAESSKQDWRLSPRIHRLLSSSSSQHL